MKEKDIGERFKTLVADIDTRGNSIGRIASWRRRSLIKGIARDLVDRPSSENGLAEVFDVLSNSDMSQAVSGAYVKVSTERQLLCARNARRKARRAT